MKVELTPTITNQKVSLFTKVRKFFSNKLKPLTKDTFEKGGAEKNEKDIIVSRKHPNWCDTPEDGYRNNTIAETVCYYPDDVKKMESMTKEEQYRYMDHLDKVGRFYYDKPLTKEKFETFMRSLGLDPNEFYIKDKK